MAAAGPQDHNPKRKRPEPGRSQDERPGETPRSDEFRVKLIHQPKDKSAKSFYGDKRMVNEFLDKHVFGKVVVGEIVARLELSGLWKGPTEYIDSKSRTVRHADMVWKAPFRDSWLYVVFLFEAQSTVDWRMPVRILLETALVYAELAKDSEVQERRKLPPVLPIVVYVGTKPWDAPTRLKEMLTEEAKAFLPFALGHEFLLVSEAEEAKTLTRADTPRTAGLRLRYARDRAEFDEALATLRELLPEDSPARRALVEWVRSSMIEEGAKEEEMAKLRELEDLESPVVDTWWAAERRESHRKGLEEGRRQGLREGRREGRQEARKESQQESEARARLAQQATLVRQAQRKFGSETAEGLAALLEGAADLEGVAEVADLIIDCASGRDFLAQAAGALA